MRHSTSVRRVVPPSPARTLDLFAAQAETDAWERVFPEVARAANAVLEAEEYVCWWHVRLALYQVGKLSGAEACHAAGRFARRLGLVAQRDENGNVVRERPSEEYNRLFPKGHSNCGTRWIRPRPALVPASSYAVVPRR